MFEEVLGSHLGKWPGRAAAGVVAGASGAAACSGPADEPFAWASVSKLLVCLACLVAVEERTLSLEDAAGPPGSTLAHLLAHASGLPFEGQRAVAPPGHRRIYSNTGTEEAARHLEARSAMPYAEYLTLGVLGPLGMEATRVDGSPAYGATGPLSDLLKLAGELLSPTLVSNGTWSAAISVAWPGLAGVLPGFGRQDPCDWGLGPEIRGRKWPHWTGARNSPATYGHFGQSGSFVWVDPEAGLALASLGSEPFGEWAKGAWPALSDAVLASGGG
jgi:CubicO group peptidase (beta-lactamase class C family)